MVCQQGTDPAPEVGRTRTNVANVLPCFGLLGSRLQSSSTKCRIRKAEVTSVTTLQLRWKTVHELWLGRGDIGLNKVSEAASVLHCHARVLPNDRDKMSEIVLHFPSMRIGVSGQAR